MRSVIELAKEAGFEVDEGLFPFEAAEDKFIGTERVLESFAALVRAEYEKPLKLAGLVEASVEECMGDDGMVAVIPIDLYNDLMAAIREALAEPEITTPDVCGEVCARAKLCYGCNKAFDEALADHVEQSLTMVADHSGDANEMVSEPVKQEPVAVIEVFSGWEDRCMVYPTGNAEELPDGVYKLYAAPVQPVKQEPVVWGLTDETGEVLDCISNHYKTTQPCTVDYDLPLYAAPVQPVKQEPVAWIDRYGSVFEFDDHDGTGNLLSPLYAAPVRTKDLTDSELMDCRSSDPAGGSWLESARAVIAKFKEKNK